MTLLDARNPLDQFIKDITIRLVKGLALFASAPRNPLCAVRLSDVAVLAKSDPHSRVQATCFKIRLLTSERESIS